MKIVAVTSCPTGIAYTFMAAEALQKAVRALGHTIKALKESVESGLGEEEKKKKETTALTLAWEPESSGLAIAGVPASPESDNLNYIVRLLTLRRQQSGYITLLKIGYCN